MSRARGGLSPAGFFHVFPGSQGRRDVHLKICVALRHTTHGRHRKKFSYEKLQRAFEQEVGRVKAAGRAGQLETVPIWDIPGVNCWGLASNILTESLVMVG